MLLAGGSGALGTALAGELKRRGYTVRVLTRSPVRVGATVDEVFVGDLTAPRTLAGSCKGVDLVFSCAGAPPRPLGFYMRGNSYSAVDDFGNRGLLRAAMQAGVPRFGYVSVYGGRTLGANEYIRAHESFAAALRGSGLVYTILRSTAFFASLDSVLSKARKRRPSVIGGGQARTNPIHHDDLAAACVDAVEGPEREIEIGGPRTYTRREIAEAALAAWGREPKVRNTSVMKAVWLNRLTILRGRHNHDISEYLTMMALQDAVAPEGGSITLEDYFAERVREWVI